SASSNPATASTSSTNTPRSNTRKALPPSGHTRSGGSRRQMRRREPPERSCHTAMVYSAGMTDIRQGIRELARLQYSLVKSGDIRRLGGNEASAARCLRSGEWEEIGDGVYRIAGTARSWRQDLQIALFIAGPGA